MEDLIAAQRRFFNTDSTKDIAFRIKQLRTLHTMLSSNEPLLNEAIYADMKKSVFETYATELAMVYTEINLAVKQVRKWAKPKKVSTNFMNFPATSYIIPEPLGVALVIGAWNYPYQLSFAPVVAAMAAGCTVVLKPSELPSHTSAIMAQLVKDYFDPQFFTVVEGGIPETTALLEQPFDKVFFTGSPAVGRTVYQAAARHLTPVTLELGGKSPAFITESCRMDRSVQRLVWAKFLNAGQTCIAPDYVLVHRLVQDVFLSKLKSAIEKADYSFENGNYIQIINERNLLRLAGLIDKDKIYVGGSYRTADRYFEPTILNNVNFNDKVMQEEIFGPMLPVISYDNIDEAIAEVKKRPKPLSCYVFTSNKAERNAILKKISFGGGAVNDAIMHISNNNLPFGGVGNSGLGSYHAEAGFRAFSHYKSILNKPTWFEAGAKYPPYTIGKLKLMKRMLGGK